MRRNPDVDPALFRNQRADSVGDRRGCSESEFSEDGEYSAFRDSSHRLIHFWGFVAPDDLDVVSASALWDTLQVTRASYTSAGSAYQIQNVGEHP